MRRGRGGDARPSPRGDHPRHAHAPPQAHPPADDGARASAVLVLAAKENRLRTRSLPHEGQASAVPTEAVIGRRSSNRRSHARHTYS